jgi:hypothetical protein
MPQMMQIAGMNHETPGQTYDQTLALRPDMALASGSNTSVALTAADLQMRSKQMEQRRHDRQRHHHSQIWTKDFHGGPYRKASGLHLTTQPIVSSKIWSVACATGPAACSCMQTSSTGR